MTTQNPFAAIAALLMGQGNAPPSAGTGAFEGMDMPPRGAAASGTLFGTIDALRGIPTNEAIAAANTERVSQRANARADRGPAADAALAQAFQSALVETNGDHARALSKVMNSPAFVDAFSHGNIDRLVNTLKGERSLNTPTPPMVVQTPEGGRTELVNPSDPTTPGRVITNPRAPVAGAAELETDKVRVRRGAQMLDRVGQEGDQATRVLADLSALEGAMANIKNPNALMTGLRSVAAGYGLPVENANDLQLVQAIIGRLGPAQRTPGVGPMSDFETRSLMSTLPNAWQSPDGRKRVANQMRAMAEHARERGSISNRFYDGELTVTQAFRQLELQERSFVERMKRLREATGTETLPIGPGVTIRPR